MKKNWFSVLVVMVLLVITARTPVQKDSAGRSVGDPTGRVFNPALSCVDHCSGYAASGNDWCFCDASCQENGNCCSDFETACPNPAG